MALTTQRVLTHMNATQLRNYIQAYGKTVNQRIVALEKNNVADSSVAYRYITERDPNRAKLIKQNKSGYTKLDITTRGLSRNELLSKASTIQGFLNARTSTISGIKQARQKGFERLKERRPSLNITQKEFSDIVTHSNWDEWKARWGSERTLRMTNKYDTDTMLELMDNMDKIKGIRDANKLAEDIQKSKKEKEGKFEQTDESPFES